MFRKCPDCGQILIKYNNYFVCKTCNTRFKLVRGKLKACRGDY